MRIANNITELIGNTPLVYLNKMNTTNAKIVLKLEYFNPLHSVKDRIALAMIEDAEKKGFINKNSVIIEPTSGNTGIGLAYVCAVKGYKLILTMPDTMSIERRKLLKALGADLILTDGSKGMKGAIEKAEELLKNNENYFMPMQFSNRANVEMHKKTTAQEILRDTEGKIDIFIAGVGTGGTLTGVGEVLKEYNKDIKIIAVEPFESPVISGGKPSPHKIQGIGAGFIPDNLNLKIIDEIITVKSEDAGNIARELAKKEGILCGISAGANVWAALEIAKRKESEGKTILTIIPDTGERYLSTWLFEE